MDKMISENIKGKRVASIDYGLKRVGIAVCDELHISITPKIVLDPNKEEFWDKLVNFINGDNIGAIVVGVPVRHDYAITDFIKKVEEFIEKIKTKLNLPVYTFDEAFTSRQAVSTMVSIGKRKKKRSVKGSQDLIAAAIILRDFLNENE